MRFFLNFHKIIIVILSCFSLFTTSAQAGVNKVYQTFPGADAAVKVAKIYYTAEVNTETISDLARVIDELNIGYKNLEAIYLYVSSYGGEMDAGYVGYWLVKGSRIPVTAVNISTVGSAASIIFCGADDRQSLQGGRFILHPANLTRKSPDLDPDSMEVAQANLASYNQMLRDIYKKCTTFEDVEINSFLERDAQRKFLLPEQAMAKGIITKIADNVVHAQVAYYITNSNKK